MFLDDSFHSSFLATSDTSQRKNNQRAKSSSKLGKSKDNQEQYRESLSNQNDFTAELRNRKNVSRFFIGMDSKEYEIQIFIIKQSRGFKESEISQKFLNIVEQADGSIQRWYFELGSSDKLPEDLDVFIVAIENLHRGKEYS
ncbi:hypothetical protein DMUE_2123 [Dictyocoela muelleri]|nr:hypothetical protein DMUE_2123 [Dictyocoela muelleri]